MPFHAERLKTPPADGTDGSQRSNLDRTGASDVRQGFAAIGKSDPSRGDEVRAGRPSGAGHGHGRSYTAKKSGHVE